MRKLYFITGSKGKFQEVESLIPYVEQIDIDLPEIQEIDATKIITAKVSEAFKHHTGPCIIEDTSLYITALHGLPGPLIKWFMKTVGNDGLVHIASSYADKTALAKTIIGYGHNSHTISFFEGVIPGTIVSPRGTQGFGWDAIFQPDGSTKTFGEMIAQEKSEYSMRKIAVMKLQQFLQSQ